MFICLDHGDEYNSPSSTSHCSNYEYEMFLELWGDGKLYLSCDPLFYRQQIPIHWSSEMAFPRIAGLP